MRGGILLRWPPSYAKLQPSLYTSLFYLNTFYNHINPPFVIYFRNPISMRIFSFFCIKTRNGGRFRWPPVRHLQFREQPPAEPRGLKRSARSSLAPTSVQCSPRPISVDYNEISKSSTTPAVEPRMTMFFLAERLRSGCRTHSRARISLELISQRMTLMSREQLMASRPS